LVSNNSPLAQENTIFYNTLFDENTSCHIGIGNASPSNLKNGINLSRQELKDAGLNKSLILVNLSFGTPDMNVLAIKENGEEVLVIKNGAFQF
jgi:aminopeptidase